ncbi:beta-ketoacyl-ACP synthase III [Haliangium ochraceum]|uniref:Beta-ketoacyl-[acyl-carrier-protein] synthase III n=1 Tax=Haliangium ochraceum (strain DSM 14365 / JCM 11303 / SMP-2) TaxID=502025 RepID=D0LHL1_HALO1|nr:beta-ketoacyl-ACP synthase III [Haliangium ochraceum]ACY12873.1 3-oxoacyl-(acyl-carrier-protein) synthase III [Haliangium ochraceum DSM 14365]
MIRTRFVGTGRSVPERAVSNEEIARRVETSDEWIRTRTGIRKRHVLGEHEATSDMAAAAGRQACEAAGIALEDIECIVVATTTPDMPMPSCAMLTQAKLGIRGPAFDVAAACAGFTYGTTVVDSLIRSGQYKRVLFIGAEALSKFLDWDDRGTCILFGDGAGAVVAVAEEQDVPDGDPRARGILSTFLDGDGSLWRELNIPGGGTACPPSEDSLAQGQHYLRMNGRVIFSHAVRNLSEASETALARAGLSIDDVDLVIPHQANLRILDAVAKRTRIPREKFIVNLDEYGNTSAASIPIALDDGVRSGRIQEGMLLVHCGLGAGLTWGAVVVRW